MRRRRGAGPVVRARAGRRSSSAPPGSCSRKSGGGCRAWEPPGVEGAGSGGGRAQPFVARGSARG